MLVGLVCAPTSAEAQDPDSVRVIGVGTDPIAMDSLAADSLAADSLYADFLGADSLGADSLAADALSAPDTVFVEPLPEEAIAHIGHLTEAFVDTPAGMGLIATGMAEAEIAAEYVRVAGRDTLDLANMVRNMVHVLHAIDPVEVGNGNGLGYGVKRAAQNAAIHIRMAMEVEGVNENFLFHAPYVLSAAYGTISRADVAIATARSVQRADDPVAALRLINRLADQVRAMAYGFDGDRDGRIGQNEAEFGLAQATYHLNVVRRYQGLQIPEIVPDTIGAGH